MNKKLLAVAVGAALAASAGISQADVKVYGVAHVSVDNVDLGTTTQTNDWNVADNSSRFGVKVKEDVGSGWAGLAQFEIFVDNTDATTVNANRNNFVGIEQKSIGQLLLGRMDSAVKDVGGIADLFFREQLGESRAIIHVGNGAPDSRYNESVTYNSPKLGPATFKIQWFGNDSATNTNNGFNANVKIALKPVTVGVGYWKAENTGENTDGYRLAVKAPIGPVTLAALYQQANSIGGVVGADAPTYGVGVAFKFLGSNTIKAQYYVTDSTDNAVLDNGANQLSVGYDYNFSKTTVVYVAYAKVTNDVAANFALGGNGHGEAYTGLAGGDVSGFSLGTRVAF